MTNIEHSLSPLTVTQQNALMSNLNQARVSSRKQGRSSLSYLEAYDVKATLVRVFGFGGFSAEADQCEIVKIENNINKTTGFGKDKVAQPIAYQQDGQIDRSTANYRVTARVRVTLTIHQLGAVYTEWAASSQTGPDLGDVTDFAIKTAESDALKRAAIYLGSQFGLSLYNAGSTNDVIRLVLAPGQEWHNGQPVNRQISQAAREVSQGASEPAMPNGVSEDYAHREEEQEPPQQGAQPVSPDSAQQDIPQGDNQQYPNVTDAQHEANKAILAQALDAKEVQQSNQQNPQQ